MDVERWFHRAAIPARTPFLEAPARFVQTFRVPGANTVEYLSIHETPQPPLSSASSPIYCCLTL